MKRSTFITWDQLKVGVIGGGLMGREVASAIGRWCALLDFPVKLELTAVCDLVEKTREWFRQIPTVSLLTADHRELLASDVDFVYVAVPHHLHLDETVRDAIDLMQTGTYRNLPLLDDDSRRAAGPQPGCGAAGSRCRSRRRRTAAGRRATRTGRCPARRRRPPASPGSPR